MDWALEGTQPNTAVYKDDMSIFYIEPFTFQRIFTLAAVGRVEKQRMGDLLGSGVTPY